MELGQEFKLRNGEAARVGHDGLVVRFERVTVDGRCPVGDPCTSDVGDAVVRVIVQQQGYLMNGFQFVSSGQIGTIGPEWNSCYGQGSGVASASQN